MLLKIIKPYLDVIQCYTCLAQFFQLECTRRKLDFPLFSICLYSNCLTPLSGASGMIKMLPLLPLLTIRQSDDRPFWKVFFFTSSLLPPGSERQRKIRRWEIEGKLRESGRRGGRRPGGMKRGRGEEEGRAKTDVVHSSGSSPQSETKTWEHECMILHWHTGNYR